MRSLRIVAALGIAAAGSVSVVLMHGSTTDDGSQGIGPITLAAQPITPGTSGISDSLNGKPIISVNSAGMSAGKPVTGSVTITNTGNSSVTVTLGQTNLTSGPSPTPNLASYANLIVTDATLNKILYSGTVSGFARTSSPLTLCGQAATNNGNGNGGIGNGNGKGNKTSSCPQWAGAESHTFTFSVEIPDQPAGSKVDVNLYQGTWLKTDYAWSATN